MEIADLCRQLGLLLHSGIRLSDSMAMMADEETDSTHKSLYTTIAEQLDDGFYLHAAFDIAGCFPAHVINLLKVGEEVGRLEETLFAYLFVITTLKKNNIEISLSRGVR